MISKFRNQFGGCPDVHRDIFVIAQLVRALRYTPEGSHLYGLRIYTKSKVDHRFYIGSTNNLERRYQDHNEGKSKYTRAFIPWELVFSQEYSTLLNARKVEYWLKKQKSRELLEKVIHEGIIRKSL